MITVTAVECKSTPFAEKMTFDSAEGILKAKNWKDLTSLRKRDGKDESAAVAKKRTIDLGYKDSRDLVASTRIGEDKSVLTESLYAGIRVNNIPIKNCQVAVDGELPAVRVKSNRFGSISPEADKVTRITSGDKTSAGVLLGAQKRKRGVPVVGDIPLIDRLFSNRADFGIASREGVVDLRNVDADEIWIISRQPDIAADDDDTAGTGALMAKMGDGKEYVPLPLKHTDVTGQIAGYIASVRVKQQFHNPFDTKIEAVYVFPLPQNAAVNEFIMTIGDRKIRGIIRERKEAEKIYQQAKRQGHVASLLTQERPNIFTQKVANIEPGKNIDIDVKYFNTLAYADGWYEFAFPMVVGPRFNPAGSTDGVGAVAAGNAGASGQKTEVQYLKPSQRSGHDISLAIDIDAGVKIEEIKSSNHAIKKNFDGKKRVKVAISKNDSIANKDFVLRYRVAGKKVKSAVVTTRDERGGFFTMMLYPPESLKNVKRAAMEMIFVLDCSGSMRGKPMAKAKDAISRALRKLGPDDSFQIIRFSNNASQLGPKPIIATQENVAKGLAFVAALHGGGGTQMIEGIKAALDFEHDPDRFRFVSFMTDGFIGNENQILAAVQEKIGVSRIFSFGVGSSPNRFLLDRMAKIGKGAVAYVGLDDSCGEIVDAFYDRITHPAMRDVAIDFGQMEAFDVFPSRVSDLFVGRPIVITGRFQGAGTSAIKISGTVDGETEVIEIPVDLDDPSSKHEGIACVWARKKIESLATMKTYDSNPEIPAAILDTALEYGLMSAYTAFLAVDSATVTEGESGVTVAVPVPVPDGVKYETTVQGS